MDISYNWLKDLVDFDLAPRELADRLTNAGLAVEGITEINEDFIFDFDLTSNRPDCLSHLGIAREIQAIVPESTLRLPNKLNLQTESKDRHSNELVTIKDTDLCPRFTARIIKNVRIASSPDWLRKRLESVGERSINNVADITNYVMLELGQPMHAFDLSKLAEERIVVRRAFAGEKIKTLDEVERSLEDAMLAICDAKSPVAVAGVMGGYTSSITTDTRNVLLEVAYFAPSNIRSTSRKLGLSTEASYRFERGVDIENLVRASDRATGLICEIAGGEAGDFIDVYPGEFVAKRVESADIENAVTRLTGLNTGESDIIGILGAIGIEEDRNDEIRNKKSRIFLSPSWRHDLTIEEDLVEEVARIVGYDKLDSLIPPAPGPGEYQPHEMRKLHLRQTLADLGFDEALSYSFIDAGHDHKFGLVPNFAHDHLDEQFVTIRDPIIDGSTRMRPTLLPGLLDAVRVNFNYQRRNLKLFELGTAFAASVSEGGLPDERELFAIVVTGHETFEGIADTDRELDFYDAKGAIETAFAALNGPSTEFIARDFKHLRTGQAGEIRLAGRAIGSIGRLHEDIAAEYKFRQPVYVAEIDLQTYLEAGVWERLYRPLPVFPSIVRDASILVKRSVTYADLNAEIRKQQFELLRNVYFVGVYEGKGVADDERSVTIRLEYRSLERTLLEEEVENVHSEILKILQTRFNAHLRL